MKRKDVLFSPHISAVRWKNTPCSIVAGLITTGCSSVNKQTPYTFGTVHVGLRCLGLGLFRSVCACHHDLSVSSLCVLIRVLCVLVFQHSFGEMSSLAHDGYVAQKSKGFVSGKERDTTIWDNVPLAVCVKHQMSGQGRSVGLETSDFRRGCPGFTSKLRRNNSLCGMIHPHVVKALVQWPPSIGSRLNVIGAEGLGKNEWQNWRHNSKWQQPAEASLQEEMVKKCVMDTSEVRKKEARIAAGGKAY